MTIASDTATRLPAAKTRAKKAAVAVAATTAAAAPRTAAGVARVPVATLTLSSRNYSSW